MRTELIQGMACKINNMLFDELQSRDDHLRTLMVAIAGCLIGFHADDRNKQRAAVAEFCFNLIASCHDEIKKVGLN